MPVLGRVSERSGKQRRFLRPRRDLGSGCQPDREIDCRAGDQGNRRTFAPTGGRGLTVVDGRDQPRQPGDIERRCVVSSRCANGCEKWQIFRAGTKRKTPMPNQQHPPGIAILREASGRLALFINGQRPMPMTAARVCWRNQSKPPLRSVRPAHAIRWRCLGSLL